MNIFIVFLLSFIFSFLIIGSVLFFSLYKKYKENKNYLEFIKEVYKDE